MFERNNANNSSKSSSSIAESLAVVSVQGQRLVQPLLRSHCGQRNTICLIGSGMSGVDPNDSLHDVNLSH